MISRLIRKLQHRLSCIAGWTENMEEKKYKAIIEGILFSMGESVELEKIAGALGLDQKKTKELIDEMRNEWEEQKRALPSRSWMEPTRCAPDPKFTNI